MANEDRIRAWRAKRQAGLLATDPQANALTTATARTAALVGRPGVSIQAIVQILVDSLPAFPDGSRHELYDKIKDVADAAIEERDVAPAAADFWRRRIRGAIRMFEADVRKGADVFAAGYLPDGLAEYDARLETGHDLRQRRARIEHTRAERRRATREDKAHAIAVKAEELADLARLRPVLDYLHASQRPTVDGTVPRILTIGPLFLLRFLLIQADSSVALLWVFVGPLIIMILWSAMYILSGTTYVLGMDVATFTLTGVVMWVMLRQIVFRSSEAYVGARGWLNLEAISPLLLSVTTGVVYLLVYLFVLAVMIGVGSLLDIVSLPDNVIGVLAYVIAIATVAISMGLLFAGIASKWHYFMRFSSAIERFLQVFSSVFIVSEQLPVQYRKYFLWCPLAHGFQLLRSQYFKQYKSQDAHLNYFLISIVLFVVSAMIAERLARSNLQPT